MEKYEINLKNTVSNNVLQYLYLRVKSIESIERIKQIDYPDGTMGQVVYRNTIQHIAPPRNNRIEVNDGLSIEPESKRGGMQIYPVGRAISFECLQLQTDTVLLTVEFEPLFKSSVESVLNDLLTAFDQTTEQQEPGAGDGQGDQPDSGHYAYSPDKRDAIAQEFLTARDSNEVENMDAWAKSKYGISGKTLKKYVDEHNGSVKK